MISKKTSKIFSDLESGYNQMAEKFSETRKYFWRDLEFIADIVKDGDKILDFGCGNGRLLEILKNKKIEYFGVDISGELIKLAEQKYQGKNIKFQKISSQDILSPTKSGKAISVKKGYIKGKLSQDFDKRDLVGDKPFPDEYFNISISIAVFHHFPPEHAQKMAKELFRVTRKGGLIIVTVWNLEQEKYKKYLAKKGEGYIPFKDNDGKIFERYHKKYNIKDLENIFSSAGFETKKCELVNGKNIIYIGAKNALQCVSTCPCPVMKF
jgi:tRNA (uracil-5-)-methyltransferase TRM9